MAKVKTMKGVKVGQQLKFIIEPIILMLTLATF